MNRKKAFLWFFAGIVLFLGAAAFSGRGNAVLSFFWSGPYLNTVKAVCVGAFILLALKRLAARELPPTFLKWFCGIIFLPLLLLPLFRCYFKVPYIFCRSCPRQCPWGIARTWAFGSFLLLNLFGKFWCSALCPFGTFQECQLQISKKSFKLPGWVHGLSYVSLLTVTGMYLLTLFELPWLASFDLGRYEWVLGTVLAAFLTVTVSFFIPRFWCRYLCPVGTIAEMTGDLRPEGK